MTPAFQTVGEVAAVDAGPAFKSAHFGGPDEGIRLLRGDNIEPGALRWAGTRTWPESMLPGYEHLAIQEGDLILGMDRPLISAGLKLARARPSDLPALLVQRVARIRPHSINGAYLYHWLSGFEFQQHLKGSATGTQLPHVNLKSIKQFKVPRFSEAAEARIVEVLEDRLSRLDAGIDYLDAAKRRSERFRVALNHRLFARYADFLKPLSSVVVIENGQTPRGLTDRLTDTLADDVVPFFKVGDMNSGDGRSMAAARYFVGRADAGSLGLHVRSPGLVLIPKRGGAIATNKKRILATEAAYDLNTMGLRPKEPLSVDYLWCWFQGVDLGRIADGSSVPQINAKQVKGLSIPVISREEQDGLVAELDDFDGSANRLLVAVASVEKRASSLRRALFAAAFTGKLTGAPSEVQQIEEIADSAVETKAPEGVLL
ncbi:hypothetical protein ACFV11_08285 [Streptomyces globisporus]|uniref:restriction endonuclease subunit S n=1 Tax=Streptomyces globisporus TaxID=1908 RepID=UPI00369F92BF